MKTKYLVVDTTAFIVKAPLHDIAEKMYTISEVLDEIRNKRQLRHLASLTYDLEIKDVFPESFHFVKDFAKKTGDFSVLSLTDMKLIALTYQLEKEHIGIGHLRTEPIQEKNNSARDEESDSEYLTADEGAEEPIWEDAKVSFDDKNAIIENSHSSEENFDSKSTEGEYNFSQKGEESSDDEGWITPENIREVKLRADGMAGTSDIPAIVGCITTDFAMQNVLKQIGLNVVALDGRVIEKLRTHVLRCYACYKIIPGANGPFCPNCGYKTLKRVGVEVDGSGYCKIFINFKKPIPTRGKRFPLPLPQGGKHAVNPKLAMDARRPHQKPSRLAKTKTDALHPDYMTGVSPFATRDIYSKSAQLGFNKGKPVFKYWMRRNPNEAKRLPKK